MTLPELEKATGKPAKELEPLLYQMSCVGCWNTTGRTPAAKNSTFCPMFVPGSAEFFNMNKQPDCRPPRSDRLF